MYQELEPIITTEMEQMAIDSDAWLMVTDVTLSRRQVGVLVSEPGKNSNYWARTIGEALDYAQQQGIQRLLMCSEQAIGRGSYYLLRPIPVTTPKAD